MPNFGIWELAIPLVALAILWALCFVVFAKLIPTVISEIRRIWYDAKPDDHSNHR